MEFDPAGPYAITVGAANEIQVTPTVTASNGQILDGTAPIDVAWSTEDPSIAVVLPTPTELTLRGIAPGTTNLIAKRKDNTIIQIPDPGIEGQPLAITVT